MTEVYNCYILKIIFPSICQLCHKQINIYNHITIDDYNNYKITVNTFCCNKDIAIISSHNKNHINLKFWYSLSSLYIYHDTVDSFIPNKLTLSIHELIPLSGTNMILDEHFTADDYHFLSNNINKDHHIIHFMANRIDSQTKRINELQESIKELVHLVQENREQILYLLGVDEIKNKYEKKSSDTLTTDSSVSSSSEP